MMVFHPDSPFWQAAFRPFFLIAALLSVGSVAVWLLLINGLLTIDMSVAPVLWHVHEMLFGFVFTVAAGFLLTAVQSWTGLRSVNGFYLVLLVVIWGLQRFLIITDVPRFFILVNQALWWGLIITPFASLLVRVNSRRNYVFILLLLVLAALNLAFLNMAVSGETGTALHLARSSILFFLVMAGIIAGRIVPLFTRSGVMNSGNEVAISRLSSVQVTARMDQFIPFISFLAAALYLVNGLSQAVDISPVVLSCSFIFIGILHIYRWTHWAPLSVVKIPLLWSLHASYFALGIGLIICGISAISESVRFADALHILTIGTMGLMILSMMCRVSNGHTGRIQSISQVVVWAFLVVIMSAVSRVLFPFLGYAIPGWNVSALLWISAFLAFLISYFPVLTGPEIKE